MCQEQVHASDLPHSNHWLTMIPSLTNLRHVLPAVVPRLLLHPGQGRFHALPWGELAYIPEFDGLIFRVCNQVAAVPLCVCVCGGGGG